MLAPGIEVSRRGRKRAAGDRYPSGDVKPKNDIMDVVLAQPHRRHLKVVKDTRGRVITDHRRDQRAESVLGSLNLRGNIDDQQYEAGKKFAAIVKRYRAVICAPDPLMDPEPGTGADIPPDEAKRRKAAYDDAFHALADAGHRAQKAVSKVAVHDNPLSTEITLEQLRCGLSALVKHFGMAAGRR